MGKSNTIVQTVEKLRSTFNTNKTKPIEWRKEQLKALLRMLTEDQDAWCEAMHQDLHKPTVEAKIIEMGNVIKEIQYALKNLSSWVKPKSTGVSLSNLPASGKIYSDPLGVVCIFGAWNFPLAVTLGPLVPAIAAGNCAVIKPSDMAGATADLLAKSIPKYLDPTAFQVVMGGPSECTTLLEQKFDHIFFTGSERVGRIVYEAAAKQLTPVTLELGGKSPVIVDESANLQVTARRLLWAKNINCGQVCIAPDYVMVLSEVQEAFYDALKVAYDEFYPEGKVDTDTGYSRIIDERNTKRLLSMLEEDEKVRGKLVTGGKTDLDDKLIVPTVLRDTSPKAKLMAEEIFGPLLPCFTIQNLDEGIDFIKSRPKPLSAYIFSMNQSNIDRFVSETTSGGVVVNDVIVHFGEVDLPFGGVGSSGIGNYHGKAGFTTFSHQKSVLHKSGRNLFDPSIRYPPMTENKIWLTEKLL